MKRNIRRINNEKFNDSLKQIWSPGKFNPNGSYTGISYDYESGYENMKTEKGRSCHNNCKVDGNQIKPVQDTDDL